MSDDDEAPKPMRDVLFVHGPNERGDGLRVIRKRDEVVGDGEASGETKTRVEIGELREAKDGMPIHGDLVRLKPRTEHDRLFDVETLHARPAAQLAAGHGPAQVASDRYREGWDAIFGEPGPDPTLN
jgi:hypothetical protein